eukprot:scaffold25916_cov206-Amphora_coffeaeformis.AAC.1
MDHRKGARFLDPPLCCIAAAVLLVFFLVPSRRALYATPGSDCTLIRTVKLESLLIAHPCVAWDIR